MSRILSLSITMLAMLLAPSILLSQISLVGPTKNIEVGEIVDYEVAGLGEDDLPASKVTHFPRDKVRVKPYLTWGKMPMIEFSARQPGKYLISVASCINGKLAYAEVVITVEGQGPDPSPDPDPDPDPDPPPPGKRKIIVFAETGSRTTNVAQMLMSLRSSSIPSLILDPNHVVPPEVAKYRKAVEDGISFPAVVVAVDEPDGKIIHIGRLPDNWPDLKAAIEKHGGVL